MRIVHFAAPAPFGGLESVLLTLTPAQAAAGHEVTVVGSFTDDPSGQPFWAALGRFPSVERVELVLGARAYRAEAEALGSLLAERRADVLHTHGYRSDLVGGLVAWRAGVATVTTVHGFTGNGWKNRAYEWLQRRAFRRFDAVVGVSPRLGSELRAAGVPERALHVIPNAWAPASPPLDRRAARETLGLPPDSPIFGWVGRLGPEKAPDVALAAFEAFGRPSAHLSFVGTGPMREELEARARDANLGDRVRWHGAVPEAGRLLRAYDALVISSWTEGTPMVLLEAMAAEVPVVTTAVGGIPDVVSEREALLVQPGDVQGIADALRRILDESREAGCRAALARERLLRERAVDPWVRQYDAVYRFLCSQR